MTAFEADATELALEDRVARLEGDCSLERRRCCRETALERERKPQRDMSPGNCGSEFDRALLSCDRGSEFDRALLSCDRGSRLAWEEEYLTEFAQLRRCGVAAGRELMARDNDMEVAPSAAGTSVEIPGVNIVGIEFGGAGISRSV